jgi:uncharacterized protein (DUF305 family)
VKSIITALSLAIVGCRSTVPLASPGADAVGRQPPGTASAPRDALVAFMQGMIAHHAQALHMTALVAGRAMRPEIRLLAERIDVSQKDEIEQMRRWLRARGHALPPADAHTHAAMGHGDLMPGMLTQAQLDSLASASGTHFDRLFLQGMIRHHDGALRMVADLLGSRRNLDAETFRMVSEVDVDQRAEIQRMQALLKTIP